MNPTSRAPQKPYRAMSPLHSSFLHAQTRTHANHRDDDLSLFLNMPSNNDGNLLLHHHGDRSPLVPPVSKPGTSPVFKIVSSARTGGLDDFLNSDADKNDYNWLLTPPDSPLFPSLDKESCQSPTETPKPRPTSLKSRLANSQDSLGRNNSISRKPSLSSGTSAAGTRQPLSSGRPGSVTSRPSTPISHPTSSASSRPSRSSTPTSRATFPSKPVIPPRSSTPVRSSTPTSRSSVAPPNKPLTRASTPTKRPSGPSASSSLPASSNPPGRSSSVSKSAPLASMTSLPTHGSSPTIKSRPWKPSEMPGFSLDVPPNLRTSLPERSTSASRGRPGAPSSRSSSTERVPLGRPRRQSCSPARGRGPNPNGSTHAGFSSPTLSCSRGKGDNTNPVVMGNKMVERVISARRLAPPKQDLHRSANNCHMGKSSSSSSSLDSSGFGRNLSKKSLDMALRHMDIKRSTPNSLRPLMTNIPASSMYSVRSGNSGKRGGSVPDSPLATSSNASSERSVNNNSFFSEGIEVDG